MKIRVSRKIAGFTLTEILVVILIIVTIAALSMVGISRIRTAGERAATVSIMRQMQVANMGYASDHNGQYLEIVEYNEGKQLAMEWYRNPDFLTYLTGDPTENEKTAAELLIAPVSVLDPIVVRAKKRYYNRLAASYGLNNTGLTWPTDDKSLPMSYKISDVDRPSRTAFIMTATDYQVSYGSRNLWQSAPVEGKTTNQKMAYRHGDSAVVIYYDGSTGFVTLNDIARFDREGGVNNPFWRAKKL